MSRTKLILKSATHNYAPEFVLHKIHHYSPQNSHKSTYLPINKRLIFYPPNSFLQTCIRSATIRDYMPADFATAHAMKKPFRATVGGRVRKVCDVDRYLRPVNFLSYRFPGPTIRYREEETGWSSPARRICIHRRRLPQGRQ